MVAAGRLAIVTGFAVDLNLITIHRFYRDRLMEAFLPDVDQALRNRRRGQDRRTPGHPLQTCATTRIRRAYHIINTNVVLTEVQREDLSYAGRRQLHPDAALLRQQRDGLAIDRRYMGDELTVPTAMAISGAAANPWTAAGSGVTRNPLVGMLMALMDLRLGFWVPEPER